MSGTRTWDRTKDLRFVRATLCRRAMRAHVVERVGFEPTAISPIVNVAGQMSTPGESCALGRFELTWSVRSPAAYDAAALPD
jgi:hypothetical protein